MYAAVIASASLGWQAFTWRRARAFDVRVSIAPNVAIGPNEYEIVVVATNHGATHEAVQEVWLQYAEHGPIAKPHGAPSVRITSIPDPELPPNRNVRVSTNLLGDRRFAPIASGEITALVVLESGRHVVSDPHRPVIQLARLAEPER